MREAVVLTGVATIAVDEIAHPVTHLSSRGKGVSIRRLHERSLERSQLSRNQLLR
jgi:hypothetical protein